MLRITTLAAAFALSTSAFALSLADLSQTDASGGLKDALIQGAQVMAVTAMSSARTAASCISAATTCWRSGIRSAGK